MFDHMSTKNLSEAEMQANRRKKRKLNEISNVEATTKETTVATGEGFKQPTPVNAGKKVVEIKECPFNPFNDDSCDMCGA
jgi:hypothetical protein